MLVQMRRLESLSLKRIADQKYERANLLGVGGHS